MLGWLQYMYIHVADDALQDFKKLTEVNTERRSNAAWMQVQQ